MNTNEKQNVFDLAMWIYQLSKNPCQIYSAKAKVGKFGGNSCVGDKVEDCGPCRARHFIAHYPQLDWMRILGSWIR